MRCYGPTSRLGAVLMIVSRPACVAVVDVFLPLLAALRGSPSSLAFHASLPSPHCRHIPVASPQAHTDRFKTASWNKLSGSTCAHCERCNREAQLQDQARAHRTPSQGTSGRAGGVRNRWLVAACSTTFLSNREAHSAAALFTLHADQHQLPIRHLQHPRAAAPTTRRSTAAPTLPAAMSREEVAAFLRNLQLSLDGLQRELEASIKALPDTKRDQLPQVLAGCRRRLARFDAEQLAEFDSFAAEAGLQVRVHTAWWCD